jgi:hypothetical protein
MLLATLLGWLEREHRDAIAFLREENRTAKAQLADAVCGSTMRNGDVSRCSGSGSAAPHCERWPRS